MSSMTDSRTLRSPVRLFAACSVAIVVTLVALVRSPLFARSPEVGSWGITFDLTITIPALYFLLVVRTGRARAITVAPVFVVCTLLAPFVVPGGEQGFLHQLRLIAAPLDVLTIILIVRRLASARGEASTTRDVYARVERAAEAIFGRGIAAAVVTMEVTLLWYALFCWRAQPDIPTGARAITIHRRSGWGSVVACMVVLIAFESLGIHILIQHWSVRVAWVITALDLYGMLWLIGDYHAIRLRPTLALEETVEFRHGLRSHMTIRRDRIATVERVRQEADWKRKGTLKLAMLDEPSHLIRFRGPAVVRGLGGVERTIDSIAIRPDDEGEFLDAMGTRFGRED
jgi:hypothetical protein